MEILESNKLIAEFMGLWKSEKDYLYNPQFEKAYKIEELKYHSSWDWIMRVVEKIFNTEVYYEKYIDYNSSMFSSGKIELSTNIKNVYEQVVEFINWYNTNIE